MARDEAIRWRKSSYSGGNGGDCVELAHTGTGVRDSKNATGPVLTCDVAELVRAVKDGRI